MLKKAASTSTNYSNSKLPSNMIQANNANQSSPLLSTNSACGSDSSSPPRPTIYFGENEIREIPSRNELSLEDKNALWINQFDFRIIKLSITQTIRKMVKDPKNEEIETRGLENKTPRGSKIRTKRREAALSAVLDEQDFQQTRGNTVDPKYLARLYHRESYLCQLTALQVAAKDAEIVIEQQKQDICDRDSMVEAIKALASKGDENKIPSSSLVSQKVQRRPSLASVTSSQKPLSSRSLTAMTN